MGDHRRRQSADQAQPVTPENHSPGARRSAEVNRLRTRIQGLPIESNGRAPQRDVAAVARLETCVCSAIHRSVKDNPCLAWTWAASGRWSAAWAMWPNGRSEIFAMIPGFPDIETREKRDSVPSGTYRRLVDAGVLLVDEGMHRARPSVLVDHLTELGIKPSRAVCDRFLINTLRDDVAAAGACRRAARDDGKPPKILPHSEKWHWTATCRSRRPAAPLLHSAWLRRVLLPMIRAPRGSSKTAARRHGMTLPLPGQLAAGELARPVRWRQGGVRHVGS